MSTTFWYRHQYCQIIWKLTGIFILVLALLIFTTNLLNSSSESNNNHDNDNQVKSQLNRKLLNIIPSYYYSIQLINFERKLFENEINRNESTDDENDATNRPSIRGNTSIQLEFNLSQNATNNTNCIPPTINEFPSDGLTRLERKQGFILIHVLLLLYCFWTLAIICNDYFVPAIELLCERLHVQKDVVGATFMAAASSSPNLFINCVGTFVTKGDLGIGTIVGSSIFNILLVPAICGAFAGQFIDLDWWPVSRDCLMYCIAVFCLIGTIYDGKVMWYEALIMVFIYCVYMVVMYNNEPISRAAKKLIAKCQKKPNIRPYLELTEITPLLTAGLTKTRKIDNLATNSDTNEFDDHLQMIEVQSQTDEERIGLKDNPWTFNESNSLVFFILRWPIKFLLWITIPDCRNRPKFRLMTLAISICWIGMVSYLVALLISFIGDTLNIPDSVMGLTILAAGMSIPETVSSVIVTKQGHGVMGICNSIGSKTFDILLCLGLPWLIKAYFIPTIPNQYSIIFNSSGLIYSTVSLLITLFGMYIVLVINKFQLNWKTAITCTVMYISFLLLVLLIELNVFFNVNLPVCDH